MVGAVQTAADRAVKERERRGGTKKHVGSFVYSAHSAQSRPKNMSQLADLENICPLGYNHFQETVLHAIASPSTYLFNFDGGVPIVYFRTDIDIPQNRNRTKQTLCSLKLPQK